MNKITGVYIILNKITNKFYVGHSVDIYKRFNSHRYLLKNNRHHSIYLQRAWNKYGEDNFEFIIIKQGISEEESIILEQFYIDEYKNYIYNVSNKATSGGDLTSYHPNRDLIVEKMTNSINEYYSSLSKEEKVLKYGQKGDKNGMYGKHHSNESKLKISENNKGKEPYNKNKKYEEYMSEEKAKQIKENLSSNAKLRTGNKNPFYGKHHSNETKEKIRKVHLGKKPVNCKRVKIDGVEYDSVTEAARQLGVCPATIIYRIKSKHFANYNYV